MNKRVSGGKMRFGKSEQTIASRQSPESSMMSSDGVRYRSDVEDTGWRDLDGRTPRSQLGDLSRPLAWRHILSVRLSVGLLRDDQLLDRVHSSRRMAPLDSVSVERLC